MKQITNIKLQGDFLSFSENGLTNSLSNVGTGLNDGMKYKKTSSDDNESEYYAIFNDGNLLVNNKVLIHRVLHKIGTDEFYLISMEDFRNDLKLVEENNDK